MIYFVIKYQKKAVIIRKRLLLVQIIIMVNDNSGDILDDRGAKINIDRRCIWSIAAGNATTFF